MNRLLAVALSLSCGLSLAEEAKKEAPKKDEKKAEAMPMPTLPAEGKRLVEGVLGSWKSTDVVLTMGDKAMKGKMTMACEKASEGWAALCKAKFDMGKELPVQQAIFLFGWELGTKSGHMFEVSNMADCHNHVGTWSDDKTIVLVHDGKNYEGKSEKDTLTFTWSSAKQIAVKAEGSMDGTIGWTMVGTMSK